MSKKRIRDEQKILTGHEIKRFLALLKAQVEFPDRNIVIKLPKGFKESFQEKQYFRGWGNYHVTWDISREDPWLVKHRTISLVAEWHKELIKVVPVIAPDGTIMEAEEWEQKSPSMKLQK